jgi:hypothetical protein
MRVILTFLMVYGKNNLYFKGFFLPSSLASAKLFIALAPKNPMNLGSPNVLRKRYLVKETIIKTIFTLKKLRKS